ncbi:MAG: hypothetical protein P8Z76_00500 [Alphaproteobacteria bacterium]
MKSTGIVMVVVAALVVLITLRPRLLRARLWRATVTPLASIIGSGFLVVGPILADASGHWAWAAMLALCLTAYLFGAAIRRNILTVEPMLGNHPPRVISLLERCSDFALAFAYFVSVAYYLNLFASFALRADGIIDVTATRWTSSAVIVILGLFGAIRGLSALENIEAGAVGIKLGLIAGLFAGLSLWIGLSLADNTFSLPEVVHDTGVRELQVLLGLVILVQGFETSRYLGAEYDSATRIKTMRYAQLLSSAIYLVFILLITPFFRGELPKAGGETAIIDMLAPLGVVVAPLIIFAALASQLSAAVADMNGAGGLLSAATIGRVPVRGGYVATAAVALGITWLADIYEIIVYASKAFVLYYGLQCSLAAFVAFRRGADFSLVRGMLFVSGTVLSIMVLIFGVPADGAG